MAKLAKDESQKLLLEDRMSEDNKMCMSNRYGYSCTKKKHVEGQHVAHNSSGEPLFTWA